MISQRVRKLLDEIDEVLAEGGSGYSFNPRLSTDASDLWQVLTALRGPDSENEELKSTTTAPIRQAAFPKCGRIAIHGFGYTHGAYYGYGNTPFIWADAYTHFGQHVNVAAKVLGINAK